eukprot:366111-Chlamydomonas_euryale.AAC.1
MFSRGLYISGENTLSCSLQQVVQQVVSPANHSQMSVRFASGDRQPQPAWLRTCMAGNLVAPVTGFCHWCRPIRLGFTLAGILPRREYQHVTCSTTFDGIEFGFWVACASPSVCAVSVSGQWVGHRCLAMAGGRLSRRGEATSVTQVWHMGGKRRRGEECFRNECDAGGAMRRRGLSTQGQACTPCTPL